MRLVHAPDGSIDRYDRALWLTVPFDMAFEPPAVTASPTIRRGPSVAGSGVRRGSSGAGSTIRRTSAGDTEIRRGPSS